MTVYIVVVNNLTRNKKRKMILFGESSFFEIIYYCNKYVLLKKILATIREINNIVFSLILVLFILFGFSNKTLFFDFRESIIFCLSHLFSSSKII